MNKNQSSTKILIMYHCLSFCKLTFDLDRNTKLQILNINYYKIIFEIKLNFILKLKIQYLYAQNKFASYIIIHLHK